MSETGRPGGFFASRWRGEPTLAHVFWRDMMLFGSALNVLATFVALAIAAKRAPAGLAAAVHFAIVPYNVFLFLSVWRNAGRASGLRIGAALWLIAATIL